MSYTIATLALTFLLLIALTSATADVEGAAHGGSEATKPGNLVIALLQMESDGVNQEANLNKADQYCREAAKMGADIALMPEMWNIGYADYPGKTRKNRAQWEALAVSRDSAYVKHFESLAKELNMAIVVTYLETWPDAPRNAATLIDRKGKQVFTYAKVHTCDFGKRESACTPGDDFYVGKLDTAKGKISVGIMICYDREHPESALVLTLKGAELILTPNACVLDDMRLDQLKVRAYENAVVTAIANYPEPHAGCNGHSAAFGARGKTLVEAGDKEGIHIASFDIHDLREYRKKTIWGGAFRRPQRYSEIVKQAELPEFQRKNAFGEKFEQTER